MGYRSLDAEDCAFFNHWLQNNDGTLPAMVTLKRPVPQNLWCTSTGQVVTALPGKTICPINRERVAAILPSKSDVSSREKLAKLHALLKKWIPSITGMNPVAQISLIVTVTGTEQRAGYRMETLIFHSRTDMGLSARISLPDQPGARSALRIPSCPQIETLAAVGSDFERTAQAGKGVFLTTPLRGQEDWTRITHPGHSAAMDLACSSHREDFCGHGNGRNAPCRAVDGWYSCTLPRLTRASAELRSTTPYPAISPFSTPGSIVK